MTRRRITLLALAAVLAAAATPARADPVDKAAITVVDGDSISVSGQEWRLRGFDAAEIGRAQCEAERRLGLLTQRRLEQLLAAASKVELEGGTEHDRYRRPLGDLVLDGRNVREVLLAEGWVRPYNGGPRKGWCSRDSRDDLVPGPPPVPKRR